MAPSVVLDTNVVVAGLRSNRGASFRLLELAGRGTIAVHLSTALMLEYEAVLHRDDHIVSALGAEGIEAVLNQLAAVGVYRPIRFRLRPEMRDPEDDFVLELAVASACDALVTFNVRDFAGAERFSIRVVTPRDFLLLSGHPI